MYMYDKFLTRGEYYNAYNASLDTLEWYGYEKSPVYISDIIIIL